MFNYKGINAITMRRLCSLSTIKTTILIACGGYTFVKPNDLPNFLNKPIFLAIKLILLYLLKIGSP